MSPNRHIAFADLCAAEATWRLVKHGLLISLALPFLFACNSEIGECQNLEAAQQLVYGPGGSVATKGQALMHESCGQAAFCHSKGAQEMQRQGAPHGMDYDMLPSPTGLADIFEHAENVWKQIEDGSMPPASYAVGDGLWTYSRARRMDEPHLPKMQTVEGRSIVRNWLACGSPVVTDSRVPDWAQPDMIEPTWDSIHGLFSKSCATAGCHDSGTAAGQLVLADKCDAYQALLKSGLCKAKRLVPGDGSSFLLDKVENETPRCGDRMPSSGPLRPNELAALRKWIEDGADPGDCK
jgi:hypothetical protein